ncbi:MAG: GAF domain-containing protein [Thermoleophilia bacterium]|nr:GAF domain-containing protein [Thermoleophilia bacterium]
MNDRERASGGGGDSFGPIRGVLLELLSELDDAAAGSPRAFYDRVCQGICELTAMNRCAVLLYDRREKRVLPAGSHGIDDEILGQLHGTLSETPIAAEALDADRVIVTSRLSEAIPARHRSLPGVAMLACVPIAAGARKLGVMLCDAGGGEFEIDAPQRDLMWALGKTVALAASARTASAQQERAKLLAERVAIAREVHDRVMQRLFGLSLVLGSGEALDPTEQRRASEELRSALDDLRDVMRRTGEPARPPASPTLREEITRLAAHYPAVEFETAAAADPPPEHEALAQSVLAEALHNASKHAEPTAISIATATDEGAFSLDVHNDGVSPGSGATVGRGGMGLRLAAFDAIQNGGVLEFGPEGDGWRVRLYLPAEERA